MASWVNAVVAHADLAAASASALATIVAAFVALLAYKLSKSTAHAQTMPVLKMEYHFGDDCLLMSNIGNGPALNLRLEHTQVHYYDARAIIRYKVEANQSRTIYNDQQACRVKIIPDRPVNDEDLGQFLSGLNLHRFVQTIGKNKVVSIIYDDVYGKSYALRFKFIELSNNEYAINLLSIAPHSLMQKLLDPVLAWRFRMMKLPREIWYNKVSSKRKEATVE